MNRVDLVGLVGHVANLHRGADARPCLRLRIATDDGYVDSHGERRERQTWHTVKVFGRAAEALANLLAKGDLVSVVGRNASWTASGPNGDTERYEVEAFRVVLLTAATTRNEGESDQ